MSPIFVLVHSPLVGPTTWLPLSRELYRLGYDALVPRLQDDDRETAPYWRQEVDSVVASVGSLDDSRPLILVGHSGAGALLAAIGQELNRPVAGCIYVDAVLPLGGRSRLDEMAESSPEFADSLRLELQAGARAPVWTDGDLQPLIPDDDLRRQLLHELNPRPLAFYEEAIPGDVPGDEARNGYLLFSPTYAAAAERARARGWTCREIPGGHFHMLVDPAAVAAALCDIVASW